MQQKGEMRRRMKEGEDEEQGRDVIRETEEERINRPMILCQWML